jgi:HEAT repeat protein
VREALLDALNHDANPGVRVEVVNMLVHSLAREPQFGNETAFAKAAVASENAEDTPDVQSETGDQASMWTSDPSLEKVIRTLEELQKRDPNRYVRLRSAAALRQIGPRELQ